MLFEPEDRLVYWEELQEVDRRSRATVYRHMRAGTFPLSLEVGGKVAWIAKELNAYYGGLQRSRLKPLTPEELAAARAISPRTVRKTDSETATAGS